MIGKQIIENARQRRCLALEKLETAPRTLRTAKKVAVFRTRRIVNGSAEEERIFQTYDELQSAA